MNNIMLHTGSRTTQIDHIVVSNYGIFVIETKNYKGWIIGNEFDDYWTQIIFKRKEKLYNPIKQNFGHIQALKSVLNEFGDVNYISIVAFTTKADLKVTANTDVVYTVNLLKTIRKYCNEIISDSVKEQIYNKLLSLNIDNKENRKEHIHAIRNNLAEKYKKVSDNICPECGGKLVLRNGKYGQFKGCSNYPKCRFTLK
ncbi:NERD domain-containing protein [Defluviitalea saccharophila]|uniref:NERD domain-containing protein n=1 Tax=Defluviitalea saccharophila TaxID=879970 RepID=A0ABZ2Y3Q0_9FIRM